MEKWTTVVDVRRSPHIPTDGARDSAVVGGLPKSSTRGFARGFARGFEPAIAMRSILFGAVRTGTTHKPWPYNLTHGLRVRRTIRGTADSVDSVAAVAVAVANVAIGCSRRTNQNRTRGGKVVVLVNVILALVRKEVLENERGRLQRKHRVVSAAEKSDRPHVLALALVLVWGKLVLTHLIFVTGMVFVWVVMK